MTLDSDATDRDADHGPDVLHRVLDGLRRLPDQRADPDREAPRADAPLSEGGGVLPRRRR